MYSLAQADWATGHVLGESYSCAEIQSVYSAATADWATGHVLGESYSCAEIQSVYSAATADWATGHVLGESYSCAEIQSVYSAARLQDTCMGESYSCAEIQSVYSAATADWATGLHDTRWGSLTLVQRYSQCILQLQPTGLLDTRLGESYQTNCKHFTHYASRLVRSTHTETLWVTIWTATLNSSRAIGLMHLGKA